MGDYRRDYMRRRVIGWVIAAAVLMPTAGLAAHRRSVVTTSWWPTFVGWLLDVTGLDKNWETTDAGLPGAIANARSWVDPAGEE
jgi:hypothetical protein